MGGFFFLDPSAVCIAFERGSAGEYHGSCGKHNDRRDCRRATKAEKRCRLSRRCERFGRCRLHNYGYKMTGPHRVSSPQTAAPTSSSLYHYSEQPPLSSYLNLVSVSSRPSHERAEPQHFWYVFQSPPPNTRLSIPVLRLVYSVSMQTGS